MASSTTVGYALIVNHLSAGRVSPLDSNMLIKSAPSVHIDEYPGISHHASLKIRFVEAHISAECITDALKYFFRPELEGKSWEPNPNGSNPYLRCL